MREISSVVYSAEKNSEQYYYRFTLIKFPAEEDVFAILLQVAVPEEWKRCKPVLEEIARTARLVEQAPEALTTRCQGTPSGQPCMAQPTARGESRFSINVAS